MLIRELFKLIESESLYKKALAKYAEKHAQDYLAGGDEYRYGANKFDGETFEINKEKLNADYKVAFNQALKALQPTQK